MSTESKTLFVRNLPYSTAKETLEDVFSDYGPIKQCFIVTDRGSGKSKGFGYVSFALREDAIKAKGSVNSIDGRNLRVDFADNKHKKTKKEKLKTWSDRQNVSEENSEERYEEDLEDAGFSFENVQQEEVKERFGRQNGPAVRTHHIYEEEEEVGDGGEIEPGGDDSGDDSETRNDREQARGTEVKDSSPKKGDMKYHRAKIVLLGGLSDDSTQEDVEKCLHKLKVKHVAEVKLVGKEIHVKFRSIREAKNGIKKLDGKTYKECELTAIQLSESVTNIPQSVLKRSRLIVRNLSFKCEETELRKAFEDCEGMTDVSIPVKPDGRKFGFGFVQFSSLRNAMKAVETMNATEILGRPVAVDWVLPKDKYEANQNKGVQETHTPSTPTTGKKIKFEDSDDEDSASPENDDDHDDDDDDDSSEDESDTNMATLKDKRKRQASDDNDSSDEDETGEDSDDDQSEKSDSDEDEEEEDYEDEDERSNKKKKKDKGKQKPLKPSDVDQGKTIFISVDPDEMLYYAALHVGLHRQQLNLSFDRNDEGLEEHFSQYGDIVYSRVVVDPQTEHSKGMGFVKFYSRESAEQCLREAEDSGIVLDGRSLIMSLAVSREESTKFNENKKKEKKDNRNLYLAREGMIRPGTQAAEGLTKLDLDKRMKMDAEKRQKLKNDNIFISPYRLCIRNIPVQVDDKKLAAIYKDAVGDKSAVITESRIMRDLGGGKGEGVGKSLGYGFISFKEHQHALTALRNTNNNPEIFGDKRRLIVEFSLENRRALEVQQRRKEKQKIKTEMMMKAKEGEKAPPQRAGDKRGKSSKINALTLSETDKKAKAENPVAPKGLPSHWGPKVRHKKRPTQQPQKKEKGAKKGKGAGNWKEKKGPEKNQGQKRALESAGEAPERKKIKKNKNKDREDNFDKMVNSYKQKFMKSNKDSHKWFE